jgi:1-deoxy-D-xylulose-5-phosphate reductoisomerase
MAAAARHGAQIIPVDSEHSGVFQVLEPDRSSIHQVTLTASGGPFWDRSLAQMSRVTPAEACAHPNWSMGAKISVDSATLMNKGLEVIEAAHLFGLSSGQLSVLVHRQSIIHALISYRDGAMLAQMSHPDMRTPIAYALGYPARLAWPARPLNLAETGQLTFAAPDPVRFPCLRLASEALAAGHGFPNVLNAANEVAVAAFLAGRLPFLAIAALAEKVLTLFDHVARTSSDSLEAILALDAETRRAADSLIPGLAQDAAVA